MDKKVENISAVSQGIVSSFVKLKFVVIACLVAAVVSPIVSLIIASSKISEMNNKIFVLDKGQVLTASLEEASLTRNDEITFQSERFHKFFFNLPPDPAIVNANISKALELSDKSVYDYHKLLQEKGVYTKLFDAQATQWIEIDSVKVRPNVYPYQVLTYASLWTMRPSSMSKSSFISECRMIDVPRTPKNLNGLKIENFVVRANELIETRKR